MTKRSFATALVAGGCVFFAMTMAHAPRAADGDMIRVTIGDLAFAPAFVTAKEGDTIEWLNADFIDHTATDNAGRFDAAIAPGERRRMTLTGKGSITYFCRYHPNMTGHIEIK